MTEEKKMQEYKNVDEIIPLIAPGTPLRAGLDEILKGDAGALIVVGRNLILECIIRGGFRLDVPLTSNNLFELSKMDGAIIISNDLKQIIYANAHLMPDKDISSKQTGIRHRSAEQTAIQTNLPVVAISKRRKNITLFFKDQEFLLKPVQFVLASVDQDLRSLYNTRTQIEVALNELTYYEFTNNVSLTDVTNIIQKIIGTLVQKRNAEKAITELGKDGKDRKDMLSEYTDGLDRELELIIYDYCHKEKRDITFGEMTQSLVNLVEVPSKEELLTLLGYNETEKNEIISPRGYRALSKIPKLSSTIIEKVVETRDNLFEIMITKPEDLASEAAIPVKTTKMIIDRLNRLNEIALNRIYNKY